MTGSCTSWNGKFCTDDDTVDVGRGSGSCNTNLECPCCAPFCAKSGYCQATNVKSSKSETNKGNIDQKALFQQHQDIETPSFTIKASGNANIIVGDKAILTKLKRETKKIISTKSVWDMTFKSAYEQYSTFTYIFFLDIPG